MKAPHPKKPKNYRLRFKQWDMRFTELKEFKKNFGHCNVPRGKGSLANWVKKQRVNYRYKKRRLTPERIEKLNRLGFSWKSPKARQAANIGLGESKKQKISHTLLINELKRLETLLGKTPSYGDVQRHARYSIPTFAGRFGSLAKARQAAGLHAPVIHRKRISDDQLLNELKHLAETLGKKPSYKDLNRHGKYSGFPYQQRFGGFKEALKKAGLTAPAP